MSPVVCRSGRPDVFLITSTPESELVLTGTAWVPILADAMVVAVSPDVPYSRSS